VARKSVVVEPSRRPRQAVVLRAGPPQSRAAWADRAALVVGVLLLLLAVWLVPTLPKDPPVAPQFRATFPEPDALEFPTQAAMVRESQFVTFDYEVLSPNIYSIVVSVSATDDAPATLPDRFTVELVAPNGTTYEASGPLVTGPSRLRNATGGGNLYEGTMGSAIYSFAVANRPSEEVFTAAHPDETLDEATVRLAELRTVDNRGIWQVLATLVTAGDCPEPSHDPSTAFQAAVCQQEQAESGGRDEGNEFTVNLVRVSAYRIEVVPLDS
jgi:hypothetical protein